MHVPVETVTIIVGDDPTALAVAAIGGLSAAVAVLWRRTVYLEERSAEDRREWLEALYEYREALEANTRAIQALLDEDP